MKTLYTIPALLLALVSAASLTGCCDTIDGNGDIRTEERPVAAFTAVDIDDGISLVVWAGDESRDTVFVETDENLLTWLATSVHDDTLLVFARENTQLFPSEGAFVAARTETLEEIEANNGSYVEAKGSGSEIVLRANNGAHIDAHALEVEDAFVDANNGGDIIVCATGRVRGKARNGGDVTVECGGYDDVERN